MRFPVMLLAAASTAFAQPTPQWRLVEEWRVGGEVDGPYSFGDVRGLGVLPNGGIVLVDYKDEQVHFLDANGKVVRTVGRKGAGPGEFQAANGLAVSAAGTVIVNDPNTNRFTILAQNGDLLKTIPITQRWGFGYMWDGYYTPDGRLDEFVPVRKPGATESSAARRVWSKDFTTIDTILLRDCAATHGPAQGFYSFRSARGGAMMSVPFQAPSKGSVQAHDGSVWWGWFPEYTTIVHTTRQSCDPDVTITLKGARIPVPGVERDSQVERVRKTAERYGAPPPDLSLIPHEYPSYDRLTLDDAGRLWVEQRVAQDAGRRYEIYSAKGQLLGTTSVPTAFAASRPMVFGRDRILGFVPDENEILWLVAYRIER